MGFLLGSSQCHVESSWVVQEADALVLIGSHARQNNVVLLSALKSVHTGDFHLLKQIKRWIRGRLETVEQRVFGKIILGGNECP